MLRQNMIVLIEILKVQLQFTTEDIKNMLKHTTSGINWKDTKS